MITKVNPKEALHSEVRLTLFRAIVGLLVTATVAAGSTYLAVRDQLVRSEEWGRNVSAQMQDQGVKLDGLNLRLYDVLQQISETNQRISRLEGVISLVAEGRNGR